MINPTEQPVLDSIAARWSPYRFEDRVVEDEKILRCLEAARWASSSFNDQPWSWFVAKREQPEAFAKLLGCLLEANQGWASKAGVLLLTVSRNNFRYNNQPNRVALHDLGQAAALISIQATQLGLQVHQMAGLNLSQARQAYNIPEGFQPQTAIAIGYPDTSAPADEQAAEMQKREQSARKRLPLSEQVFGEQWGQPARLVH